MPIDPKSSSECNVQKSTSDYGSVCNGGAARRMSWLTQMKQTDPNTLVVDLGSSFWGSSFCTSNVDIVLSSDTDGTITRLSAECVSVSIFFLVSDSLLGSSFMADYMSPAGYDVYGVSSSDFNGGPGQLGTFISRYANINSNTAFVMSKYVSHCMCQSVSSTTAIHSCKVPLSRFNCQYGCVERTLAPQERRINVFAVQGRHPSRWQSTWGDL
jgi:hypothetical protein